MSTTLTLYDRSRVTTDWTCPRKRYWQYEHDGKGVVSDKTSLELFLGTCLHDGLAVIATMQQAGSVDIDLVGDTAREAVIKGLLETSSGLHEEVEFAHEQAALIEGLLRGYYKHAWPRILSAYPEIVYIEKEMTFLHDGLTFMSKPDLVLRDKEGGLWYLEFKSTSSKREGWVNSWQTAVQLHSTVKAIEQTTGDLVTGVIVQGLYKGYAAYGKQSSPFCYAYRRYAEPPFTKEDFKYEYTKGYKRTPTWELPDKVKGWVEGMSPEMLGDQFPQAPPIFVNDALIDSFFKQRTVREQEIRMALSMMEGSDEEGKSLILDTAFDQRFDQCRQYTGRECDYLKLCHGAAAHDPLANGFSYREPHHELEMEQDAPGA